jgi:pimeloyl-ACP methyl ester carboxylesterase
MSDAEMNSGRFWIGAGGAAPMHVEWHERGGAAPGAPIVLVHGGGGQGTDWLSTPDGRPGWAPALAQRGHRVHVVDRPGHGRGAAWAAALGELGPPPTLEVLTWLFAPGPDVHPTADRHTQWPDDGALLQQLASSRSMPVDLAPGHELERAAGAALLERTGPAIVVTHSAGAPMGWLMADESPELVRALVALEPMGPPYRPAAGGFSGLPHGLTAIPLGDLTGVPVLLVSAEASALGQPDTEIRDYLATAGARVELVRLADRGVRGNGHGMIFERNHLEVLDVVMAELDRLVPGALGATGA